MDKKLFNAELRYYVIMRIAGKMLDEGDITKREYTKIRKKMCQKYAPYLTNKSADVCRNNT